MSKTAKPKKIEKIIHIHAKCDAFEIHEQLTEDKALKKLLSIRDMFVWNNNRGFLNKADKLKVKTCVVNPTLF